MTARWLAGLVALQTALGFGCGSSDGSGDGAASERAASVERAPIEVFSWGGLQNTLVTEHERRHPEDRVIHANAQLSDTARKVLRKRLVEGDPPDTFQVNAGLDLLQWVLVNQIDARESRLLPLDDLPGLADWASLWPAPLRAALSYDGHPYAVPANVHRLNAVFFNPQVLRQAGVEVPRRLDDLFVLGDTLAKRGIPLLAVGSKDPWTLSVLIIESLLIAQHGPEFYESYFGGRLEPDDAHIEQTLTSALRLLEYANPDRDDLHWEQAAQMVFDGRAAMTVMGDWARSLFDAPGVEVDSRYRELTFPGTEALFVFACNAFPLPAGAKNEAGARRLLESIASVEGQAAIGRSRTSIPARLDVDVNPNDGTQTSKQRLWRSGRLVLAQSGLVPPAFSNDLNEALAAMDREHRVSPVLHALRARYLLLGR
ncbi:MAG TPA: ABC transporter substrate-binding protein [Polyangiaceae bacterium]|nr:ABC transporter substrate-binding protein [Polyangiaceae bacterium]